MPTAGHSRTTIFLVRRQINKFLHVILAFVDLLNNASLLQGNDHEFFFIKKSLLLSLRDFVTAVSGRYRLRLTYVLSRLTTKFRELGFSYSSPSAWNSPSWWYLTDVMKLAQETLYYCSIVVMN